MLGVGADRVGIAPATLAFFAARFSYGYADRHIAVEIAAVIPYFFGNLSEIKINDSRKNNNPKSSNSPLPTANK